MADATLIETPQATPHLGETLTHRVENALYATGIAVGTAVSWPYRRITGTRAKREAARGPVEEEPVQHYNKRYAGILKAYGNGLGQRLYDLWMSLDSFPEEEKQELARLIRTYRGPRIGVHSFVNRMALVDHYMETTGQSLEYSIRAIYSPKEVSVRKAG